MLGVVGQGIDLLLIFVFVTNTSGVSECAITSAGFLNENGGAFRRYIVCQYLSEVMDGLVPMFRPSRPDACIRALTIKHSNNRCQRNRKADIGIREGLIFRFTRSVFAL